MKSDPIDACPTEWSNCHVHARFDFMLIGTLLGFFRRLKSPKIQKTKVVGYRDSYHERRRLSFAQAEGAEPLPSQLQRDHISQSLRAKLWHNLAESITFGEDMYGRSTGLSYEWRNIFRTLWVEHFHRMVDEIPINLEFMKFLKPFFENGNYMDLFSILQVLIRCEDCPPVLAQRFNRSLELEACAFRIINGDTFCPIGSSFEAEAVQSAIDATTKSNLQGARTHLLDAASRATAGEFANSIRESIHAVESVARILGGPKDSLNQALAKLETAGVVHKAMKAGFAALYGYTSDEKGIRHPLLDEGAPQVTEADALFMLGACASFVTYMITRARAAGLLTEA